MRNQQILIYIPGTKYPRRMSRFAGEVVLYFNRYFQFKRIERSTNVVWVRFFEKHFRKVYFLNWRQIISLRSWHEAEAQLDRLINRHADADIFIVAGSIGAEILLKCRNLNKVRKVVLLCPVSEPVEVNGVDILDEFSSADNFEKLGNDFLFPSNIFAKTVGDHLEKVDLVCLRHNQFVPSQEVHIGKKQTTIGESIVCFLENR